MFAVNDLELGSTPHAERPLQIPELPCRE